MLWTISGLVEPTIFNSEISREFLRIALSRCVRYRSKSKNNEQSSSRVVRLIAENVEQFYEEELMNIDEDTEGTIHLIEYDTVQGDDINILLRVYGTDETIHILLSGLGLTNRWNRL